jgi:ferredoxin
MHALIFWGFLVLLTTIVEVMGQLIDPAWEIPLVGGSAMLGLVQDVFALGVLVGLSIAVWIRVVKRPERFVGSHHVEAYRILGLIFWIVLTLFLARGARIALGYAEPWAWTPVSRAASEAIAALPDAWERWAMWMTLWAHLALILGFLVYLGYSKHLHIATSAINVFFASTRPRGRLTPLRIDLEAMEAEDVTLGAATLPDLTWKETLDLYSCTECGRCQSACPAWNTGKPLSPKLLVMNLGTTCSRRDPDCSRRDLARPSRLSLVPDDTTRPGVHTAARACRSARSTSSTSTRSSTFGATW